MNKMVLVASVIGETENHFAIANAESFHHQKLGKIDAIFKESASKYFHVGKEHCHVEIANSRSVTVNAVIEAINRADGYLQDMDKKCFDFLMDAVKSVEAEQCKDEFCKMLGSIAALI